VNECIITEKGIYGQKLVVKSLWDDRVENFLKSHDINELELNYAKGWVGKDISFLSRIPNLIALTIIDWNIENITPIHALSSVRYLEISTYCKTKIDFTAFPILEECKLEWRPKAKSIFDCHSLRKLFVNRYIESNISPFSTLTELESLSIASSPISDLHGLSNLKQLKFLGLYHLRKLNSLVGVEAIATLEQLEINSCRAISKLDEIGRLTKLKKLELCDDGNIESIAFIKSLVNLEVFLFYESTNIVDGDLTHLRRLGKLSKISFQDRKHYSHKLIDFKSTDGS